MKKISILGSTGSIGVQTLQVVEAFPQEFEVVALATYNEIEILQEQIKKFQPLYVSVGNAQFAQALQAKCPDFKGDIIWGQEGLSQIATAPEAEIVVTAVSGAIGLVPTWKAIEAGKDIALANKETLVAAGELVMDWARQNHVRILPVDSEHSAIFQCLQGNRIQDVERIILTASGGPFRTWSKETLHHITPKEALKHPRWTMGPKITIDSATLMNKGLEVIEARWLFDVNFDQIDVLVHPQSTIHSMVEYQDGSVMAQLGIPDMRIPIQYALTYPQRWQNHLPKLDLSKLGQLTFEKPNFGKFPCLKYAFDAGKQGGTLPAVMNAANEIAVHAFLEEKVGFTKIAEIISKTMEQHSYITNPVLEQILEADQWARRYAQNLLEKEG